jgi:hypothetical protein
MAPHVVLRWFESPHDIPLFLPAEVASAVEEVAARAIADPASEAAAG